jgi:hypothetical protein
MFGAMFSATGSYTMMLGYCAASTLTGALMLLTLGRSLQPAVQARATA